MMLSQRSWRVPLLMALTFFLTLPFWQFTRSPGYADFYDDLSDYFQQDVYADGGLGVVNAESGNSALSSLADDTLATPRLEQHVVQSAPLPDPDQEPVPVPVPAPAPVPSEAAVPPQCKNFPDTQGIVLVMKTGATESFAKIPTQILTSLQCIPNVLLFSDLNQQIGQYKLHDVLDRVDETIRKTYKEFRLYDAQRNCHASQRECTLGTTDAWDLDKYKFLNMVERAWEQRPGMDWYVFAEADTYIVWPNLVRWLRERAPAGDLYAGSAAAIGGTPFAHGGSGYVLSGSLVRKMVEGIPGLGAKYDGEAPKNCCGDFLVSMAVREAGARVTQAHPMFNGEKPSTMAYGPDRWCQPLLTMHHMSPEEVNMAWQYEQRRDMAGTIQIKDIYHEFVEPHLVPVRQDWDNLSSDVCYVAPDDKSQARAGRDVTGRQKREEDKNAVERRAHMSPAACARVCEAEGLDVPADAYGSLNSERARGELLHGLYEQRRQGHGGNGNDDGDGGFSGRRSCFQWRYGRGACCVGRNVRLGGPKLDAAEAWTSGWFVRGIDDWIAARGQCSGVEWTEPWQP